MNIVLFFMFSAVAYLAAAGLQWRLLHRPSVGGWILFGVASVVAVVTHALLLYHWIDVAGQQNLSVTHGLSLLGFTINVLLLAMAWRPYLLCLSLFSYPFALLSIVLAWLYPGHSLIDTGAHVSILVHILLGILVVSVLSVAALLASLVSWQERRIRRHQLSMVDRQLPPLTQIEQHLIQFLYLALFLLTLVGVSSVGMYHRGWWLQGTNGVKGSMVALAWLVMAVALWGHHILGWRGRRVVLSTWLGALLLLAVYLGI